MSEAASPPRMPVLYLGHGAPPLADDQLWTGQLADWAGRLARPAAILVVSAHWEEAPVTLAATESRPLTYDFWGFPQRYYDVTYAAPGAPELAAGVRALLRTAGDPIRDAPDRGLDHGAYVPLVEMYPAADIPVLQLSMPTLDPAGLLELGRRLAPLREEGVLIIGSGFFTHNLSGLDLARPADGRPPAWSAEFDDWGSRALAAGDLDSLLDFSRKAPAGHIAHPRTEHFAPLFVSLGAALGADNSLRQQRSVIEGFWYGLSKRSYELG